MKRQLLILIIMLFAAVTVVAQTNYYQGTTGTLERDGYTYKYRNAKIVGEDSPDWIEIYNASNPYLDVEWAYSDGTQMPFKVWNGDVPDVSGSSQTILETLNMVKNTFTSEQRNLLAGNKMIIELRVNPSTGTISDVYFSFFRTDPFMAIPVETYRAVEQALKQNLTVTVTPEGRKLTYIQIVWTQKF